MLDKKYVVLYARSSGVSEITAERDIVLTYVLHLLSDNILQQLAFKGGTCLKKMYLGKTGRFSMDLDFTTAGIELGDLRNKVKRLLHGKSTFGLDFRILDENIGSESYLAVVEYSHVWNSGSQFELQVSYREKPALPLSKLPLCDELYLKFCEFQNFSVNCMHKEELLAEKIRAAFQRIRSRDLYDLYLFTKRHYNRDIVKKLAVIKCWNVREPFDPKVLLGKVANENYDWDDLQRLVRKGSLPSLENLIKAVLEEYSYLKNLDKQLLEIVEDSKAHKEEKLVAETLSRATKA
jgi:predicted nucleotidyltransferase component of viral defense system